MYAFVFVPLPRSRGRQKIRPPHLTPEAFLPLGATAAAGKEIGVVAAAPAVAQFRRKTDDPRPVQSYGTFFISLHPLWRSLAGAAVGRTLSLNPARTNWLLTWLLRGRNFSRLIRGNFNCYFGGHVCNNMQNTRAAAHHLKITERNYPENGLKYGAQACPLPR